MPTLTAPFAFLGPTYDPRLKAVYTDIDASQVLATRRFTAALFDDAMADNAPLFKTISKYLDNRMLIEIGQAYDSGRLLFIATTNLDAQQPVIWNIGAIARSIPRRWTPSGASCSRRRPLGIAGRAVSTMITAAGYNDVLGIYYAAQRDNIGYHLAYIGSDFDTPLPTPFDQAYMRALFQYGYVKARAGYPWASKPPLV